MRILQVCCDEDCELHIWTRHRVTFREAEEAAYNHGLAVRGRNEGVYEVFGRTDAGRYLMLAVRRLMGGRVRLITAHDMSLTERRRYSRYTAH